MALTWTLDLSTFPLAGAVPVSNEIGIFTAFLALGTECYQFLGQIQTLGAKLSSARALGTARQGIEELRSERL